MAFDLATECLDNIISFVSEDTRTLFTCTLTNRHWCSVVVRILWAQPFRRLVMSWAQASFDRRTRSAYRLIRSYLACSRDEARFDYPAFLVEVDIFDVNIIIHESCSESKNNTESDNLRKSIFALLSKRGTAVQRLTLEESSISHGADLYQCICIDLFPFGVTARWLETLSVFVYSFPHPKAEILAAMTHTCHNLKRLAVSLEPFESEHGLNELEDAKALAQLLRAQSRLQTFQIARCRVGSSEVMSGLRSQAGSLRHVTFVAIPFANWTSLVDLMACYRLETLVLQACFDLSITLIAPLSLPSLRSAWIDASLAIPDTSQPNAFEVLARTFSHTLRLVNFGRHPAVTPDMPNVIVPIAQWCSGLRRFTSFVSNEDIPYLRELCARCVYLEEITIYGDLWNEVDVNKLFYDLAELNCINLRQFRVSAKWRFSAHSLEKWLFGSHMPLESLEFSWPTNFTKHHLEAIWNQLSNTLRQLTLQLFDPLDDVAILWIRSRIETLDIWQGGDQLY